MTYYTSGDVTLHLGDCLNVLPTLPDASVDAVVTDPPYELGFMGRAWDASGIAYRPEVWAQCLRVLKPGGHLLAFGGTRTYHRMVCAIEDAGFEVRDSLHWIYGSGFPKGVDVAKAVDRRRDDRADVLRVTAWLKAACDTAGWTTARMNGLFGFESMAGHWVTQGVAAAVPTPEQWARLREAVGFDDAEIRPVVDAVNGRKGLLGEAWAQREVIGQRTTGRGTGRGAVPVIGDNPENRAVTAPASEAARQWQGWSTALKPAHEPIVLARKSTGFDSTVACVLRHGTGALNIDGCRVALNGERPPTGSGDRRGAAIYAQDQWTRTQMHNDGNATPAAGRWPTNVVLSHPPILDEHGEPIGDACAEQCAPGCPVADLDQQAGVLRSGANPTRRRADTARDAYGDFRGQADCVPARGADQGGASRFFPVFRYEAKAPARERPRLPDGTTHPTVKPLALMRWLVRLVTPPGGLVLDPFTGSGTTLEAAAVEGFAAVGVEGDPAYAELCRVRLARPVEAVLDLGELG